MTASDVNKRLPRGIARGASGIIYRPLHVSDYHSVRRVWKETPGISTTQADLRAPLAKFLKANRGLSFVALHSGTIVGTVLGSSDGRRGYIYHLAVRNDFRKLGIGRSLIDLCLRGLKKRHIERCHLFVHRSNRGAMAFYRRTGWEKRTDLKMFSMWIT
jgi:ribosomal protein S18 acetylase RimI-like enzyme